MWTKPFFGERSLQAKKGLYTQAMRKENTRYIQGAQMTSMAEAQ
jgi:hypothetical protein